MKVTASINLITFNIYNFYKSLEIALICISFYWDN